MNSDLNYLDDGQIVAGTDALRLAYERDPAAVLSVCRQKTEDALRGCGEYCAFVSGRIAEARECLSAICARLRRTEDALPRTFSLFGNDGERASVTAAVCRLLTGAEEDLRRFSETCARFSVTEDLARRMNARRAEAEADLFALRAVGEKDAEPLLRELGERFGQAERLRRAFSEVAGRCAEYRMGTVPRFCDLLSDAVDLAGEGRACNPSSAARLIGEWEETTKIMRGTF